MVPSNEGRGYVLRRVIRRAVQQARAIGLEQLWPLSDVVVEQMGAWYPELRENREQAREIVRAEEERFSRTLERGSGSSRRVAPSGGDIGGEDAFRLHDTYGFPRAHPRARRERNLEVDEEGDSPA